ncbi:MAG: hypothetical protein RSB99_02705 [Bacilli bacterium]
MFNILACDQNLVPIVAFVKGVLRLIQIGIPILLIIMGTIDLGRAVLSSDEKEIKGATGKLVKRAISAIAVFFVSTIVFLLMGLFTGQAKPDGTNTGAWSECWNEVK